MGVATAFSEQVARNFYKLAAYKDEYEVARLLTAPDALAAVHAEAGPGKLRFNLHPPTLRALGLGKKIQLGPWFHPVMRLLATLKFVRGHWFDPFGHTAVRRLERRLVSEYAAVVQELTTSLSPTTYEISTRIAALPDTVRGYEDVKVKNAEAYEFELRALRAERQGLAS